MVNEVYVNLVSSISMLHTKTDHVEISVYRYTFTQYHRGCVSFIYCIKCTVSVVRRIYSIQLLRRV
jgi:hypothetical protein